MRCMIEETFGPTLPVMRVADAERGDRARQRGPVRAAGLGLDPRRTSAGERLARRIEAGVCVRQRRPGQLRRARAADGRLEGLRAGLAPRPRRDPQVHQAPVADGHARLRAVARGPHLPYCAAVTPADRRRRSRPRGERPVHGRPAARRCRSSATPFIPSLEPPRRRGATRDGFWARAASHLGVAEAIELALLQAGAPTEQIEGLRELLDSLAAEGMAAADPAGGARGRSSTAFADSGPRGPGRDRRRCAGLTTTPLLRAARPRHRPQPELGRDRLPGPRSRRRPTSRSRSRIRRPASARGGDRGRRLRGRLRRRAAG